MKIKKTKLSPEQVELQAIVDTLNHVKTRLFWLSQQAAEKILEGTYPDPVDTLSGSSMLLNGAASVYRSIQILSESSDRKAANQEISGDLE